MSGRAAGEAGEAVMVEGTFVGSGECLYSVTHHGFHGRAPHARALTFVTGVIDVLKVEASVLVDVTIFEQTVVFWAFDSHYIRPLQSIFGMVHGHRVELEDIDTFFFEYTLPRFLVRNGA
tara:strand:+ start:249 stop:608 length:360 start_codon:yes stop_codon:yes gene_type:complete